MTRVRSYCACPAPGQVSGERAGCPRPILIATQSISKVAAAPIILIWFGLGMQSKLLIAFLVAFFPTVVDTAAGMRAPAT